MSPVISFDQDDVNRGKIVEPGNYVLQLGELTEATSSKGDSTNWVFENTRIVQNADNGDVQFADVPLAVRFNSKVKGFMLGFFSALTGQAVGAGDRFDLASASGKKIIAKVINDTYDGRIVNKVEHIYRHYEGV